jgi:hypothetical protein
MDSSTLAPCRSPLEELVLCELSALEVLTVQHAHTLPLVITVTAATPAAASTALTAAAACLAAAACCAASPLCFDVTHGTTQRVRVPGDAALQVEKGLKQWWWGSVDQSF